MGTYLLVRCELFWHQAVDAFSPLKKFSFLLVLVAGHALVWLVAPLVLLGFQLFNPQLSAAERWPYLQMLLVILFCWQGSIAWQHKPAAQQYFVESLAPSFRVGWLINKLMALLNHLPILLLTLPILAYLLLSEKAMAWFDAAQLLLVLLVLCWSFEARQTSWLALLAVFILPLYSLWSLPLLTLLMLEYRLQKKQSETMLSAGSLFRYWLHWFLRQPQNKALLLLIIFSLALWQYWLAQQLKADAHYFVNSVFIWILALLAYAQQKLWQQHLSAQRYFWLSLCNKPQWLLLQQLNLLPVLTAVVLALTVFDASYTLWTIALAVLLSFWPKLGLMSVSIWCLILLLLLNEKGLLG